MNSIKPYLKLKMLAILVWSFACGLPLTLTTSTLAVKLFEAHITNEVISFFGIATIAYSLKYLFTPFVELYSPPFFNAYFGRSRAFMIITMLGVMLGLILIGNISPESPSKIWELFFAACFTVFCSSITDIAEAEYRIPLLNKDEFSHGIACYNIGYRLGMITGGGVALLMMQFINWRHTYYIMSLFILIGIIAVILQPHARNISEDSAKPKKSLKRIYLDPIKDILQRREALSLIALVVFYNYADNLLIMLLNPFLLKAGFNITEIGLYQGSIGGLSSMLGSFIAGIILGQFNLARTLFISAILFAMTNLLFIPLALFGATSTWLYQVFYLQSILGNLLLGVSTTAYATLLARQCHKPYTASQNAFLTSIMAGSKIIFMSISGVLIIRLGWTHFFILLFMLLPCLLLLIALYQLQTKPSINDRYCEANRYG